MKGASLCNSVLLHSHSLTRLQSSCSFASSSSYPITPWFRACTYISLSHRIRQIFGVAVDKRNDGFRLFAANRRRNGGSGLMESENSIDDDEEEEDDEDWGDFDVEAEGEEDEDEDEFLPMDKMKKWLERRPRGFGVGKKYETSIEDKLLDEIEQSWKAQAANLNKLKNYPLKPQQLKRDNNLSKGPGETQIGFRVRVTNLPKKKNVHRDLNAAFKEVSGILNITPAVSGNKKTKDPVCKGFALVDFKSENDANRFVEQLNGQNLSFGKVIKQIKCRVVEFSSNESVSKEVYFDNGFQVLELPYSGLEAVSNVDIVKEDAFKDSFRASDDSDEELDETEVEEDKQSRMSISAESLVELRGDSKSDLRSQKQVVKREIRDHQTFEAPSVSFQANKSEEAVVETRFHDEVDRANVEEVVEENFEPLSSSISPSEEERINKIRKLEQKLLGKEKLFGGGADSDLPEVKPTKVQGKKEKKKKKKIIVKGQAKKGSKIEIPGSSKRLKVKEKALLTGVLVKYAANSASTSNNEVNSKC